MTIGINRGVITQNNLVINKETRPGRIRKMTTPVTTQGMTQDQGTGTHPEIDMRGEDRGRGARALEIIEIIEIETMLTGIEMSAMGADAEVVTRSP